MELNGDAYTGNFDRTLCKKMEISVGNFNKRVALWQEWAKRVSYTDSIRRELRVTPQISWACHVRAKQAAPVSAT